MQWFNINKRIITNHSNNSHHQNCLINCFGRRKHPYLNIILTYFINFSRLCNVCFTMTGF